MYVRSLTSFPALLPGVDRVPSGSVAGLLAALVLLVALAAPEPARAQIFDVPSFNTPYGEDGTGLFLSFPNDVDDAAVFGTWRRSSDVVDVGFRAGLGSLRDDFGLFGGVDLKNEVHEASENLPLDIAWVTGFGAGSIPDQDFSVIRIPIGASLGRSARFDGGTGFTAYAYPRLGIDVAFFDVPRGGPGGGERDEEDADVNFDLDLGFDLHVTRNFTARIAVTVGSNDALAFGLAF